ncbi:hypothetical protein B0H10DRAFT_1953891 [Mycena sp. CBHHK59/15]|nr:hypothetical protein B0H10DRAFT_1953891 [Mycena sp. CBHHK59/15]
MHTRDPSSGVAVPVNPYLCQSGDGKNMATLLRLADSLADTALARCCPAPAQPLPSRQIPTRSLAPTHPPAGALTWGGLVKPTSRDLNKEGRDLGEITYSGQYTSLEAALHSIGEPVQFPAGGKGEESCRRGRGADKFCGSGGGWVLDDNDIDCTNMKRESLVEYAGENIPARTLQVLLVWVRQ